MDPEGYLPVTLIASFHRVRALTMDINKVLQAIQVSKELQLTPDNFKVSFCCWNLEQTLATVCFEGKNFSLQLPSSKIKSKCYFVTFH